MFEKAKLKEVKGFALSLSLSTMLPGTPFDRLQRITESEEAPARGSVESLIGVFRNMITACELGASKAGKIKETGIQTGFTNVKASCETLLEALGNGAWENIATLRGNLIQKIGELQDTCQPEA